MKKALLIGINSYKEVSSLYGCRNDVEDMRSLLVDFGGLAGADVGTLFDEQATKAAIIEAISALVAGAGEGDQLYVHFSGHGATMPSADPREPDGADEVLCPYDFDWTSTTALSDDELRALLAPLQRGAKITLTFDSCHGGDFARLAAPRLGTPRTPVPPYEIAAKLAGRSRVARLRTGSARLGDSTVIVSACQPWETAKDTAFGGRPAGAFTHFFVERVRATPAADLQHIVAEVTSAVAPYAMTPIAEEPTSLLVVMPYAAPSEREPKGSTLLRAPQSLTTLWERSWMLDAFGQKGETWVAIKLSGSEFTLHVRTQLFGGGEWTFDINGNREVSLALVLGLELRVSIGDWATRAGALHMTLGIQLASVFLAPIPVGSATVSVPLDAVTRQILPPPRSAADLVAAINLNFTTPNEPAGRALSTRPRAPGEIVPMAHGEEGWGPNWREERAVHPERPGRAIKRSGVAFEPVRGGGWVEFRGWVTDDERDPSFIMHIGNGFFGGWGSVRYIVQGTYAVDDPFPVRDLERPEKSNGMVHTV